MSEKLPDEIMVWFGQWPLAHAGTWATTRYPDEAVPYVPKAAFEKMKNAAELGLLMAIANDLPETAAKIEEALSLLEDQNNG